MPDTKMIIYIGADHRVFKLKELLKKYLLGKEYRVLDLGNSIFNPKDDYPDFASRVAKKVSANPKNSRGILICGSGVGMDIVANRYKKVRSVLTANPKQAAASRSDDDTNALSLPADFLNFGSAKKIVDAWLKTLFSGAARHRRRLKKIAGL